MVGCKWQFLGDHSYTYFYDTRLPFGVKSSPEIFHRITQLVRCMMARRGFPNIIVYLDDFLVIGATREECQLAYDTLFQLLIDLGFTLSEHKLVPPTQRLTFLGVELDTMVGTMTLPADKRVYLSFCRGSRVPCRGSRVTLFFFKIFFFGKGNNRCNQCH